MSLLSTEKINAIINNVTHIVTGTSPTNLKPISGNSLSKNYLCLCNNSQELFIKIYYAENSTFLIQQFLYANDIPIPKPIQEFNVEQNTFCAVYEYISALSTPIILDQSYYKEFASDISTILKKMHNLKLTTPPEVEDIHFEAKRLIELIDMYSISFEHKSEIIDYLLSNTVSVPEERLGLIHMDFHLKNILIEKDDKRILFTDFENLTYGDTWRDFVYAAIFHEPCENLFWHSFIQNYFDSNIPPRFWESVKYYCHIQLLRMIICEYRKGNWKEIERLGKSINAGFPIDSLFPRWYTEFT